MRSRGYYFQYAKTDLGRIFERKYAEKCFPERKSPNQGTKMVADENNYRSSAPHHAKTSECQRAGHKKGGPGGIAPGALSSGFLWRKPGSRPESGGEPRCRPGPALVQTRTTCRGPSPATLCVRAFSRESLDPRPGPGGKPTPQVLTCAGPLPPGQRLEDCFFVKSFEIHCVFLANFDKKCYPKNEERETSPEGHRNHRRPQERRGTG